MSNLTHIRTPPMSNSHKFFQITSMCMDGVRHFQAFEPPRCAYVGGYRDHHTLHRGGGVGSVAHCSHRLLKLDIVAVLRAKNSLWVTQKSASVDED